MFSGSLAGWGEGRVFGFRHKNLMLHIQDRAADSAAEGYLTPKTRAIHTAQLLLTRSLHLNLWTFCTFG